MTEDTAAIVAFFRSIDDRTGWVISYATSVGSIAGLRFTIGLALILRRHESGVAWRSAFLASAGIVGVVSGQIASWAAAPGRARSTRRPTCTTWVLAISIILLAGRLTRPSSHSSKE